MLLCSPAHGKTRFAHPFPSAAQGHSGGPGEHSGSVAAVGVRAFGAACTGRGDAYAPCLAHTAQCEMPCGLCSPSVAPCPVSEASGTAKQHCQVLPASAIGCVMFSVLCHGPVWVPVYAEVEVAWPGLAFSSVSPRQTLAWLQRAFAVQGKDKWQGWDLT